MRRGHEDDADYATIALEKHGTTQEIHRVHTSLQALRRDGEEAVPKMIPARTHERVRDYATHAVTEHHDVSGREVLIARIDFAKRSRQFVTQRRRIHKQRSAGGVMKVPDLKMLPDFRILTERID